MWPVPSTVCTEILVEILCKTGEGKDSDEERIMVRIHSHVSDIDGEVNDMEVFSELVGRNSNS